MRLPFFGIVGTLAVSALGCTGAVVPFNPVTVVATRTPGVSMVIVRPSSNKQAEKGQIDRRSEYVLLCDARAADGMHCAILPEVGGDRRSRGVVPDQAAPQVEEGLATLSDLNIQYSASAEGSVAKTSVIAPPPAAATTAPPPAPAPTGASPPPAPPPPPPPAAPAGGAR